MAAKIDQIDGVEAEHGATERGRAQHVAGAFAVGDAEERRLLGIDRWVGGTQVTPGNSWR